MEMYGYQGLVAWQKIMDFAEMIGKLVKKLPREELYALSDQMRRAAVSIPSNIAEGNGQFSSKEYNTFLSYARGSVYELQTQMLLCVRFGYLGDADIKQPMELSWEVVRLIHGLMKSIQ